jgi:hypothetical protein
VFCLLPFFLSLFTSKQNMPRFDYKQALEELKTYRLTNERRSETVAALGACLIRGNYTSKLGDEGIGDNWSRDIHARTSTYLFFFFSLSCSMAFV